MDIRRHIKALYLYCLFCGLLSFRYDKSSRKTQSSMWMVLTSHLIYVPLQIFSIFCFFTFCVLQISEAVAESSVYPAEDEVILTMRLISICLMTFFNLKTYFEHQKKLVSIINEFLAMYGALSHYTGSQLSMHKKIRPLVWLKLVLTYLRLFHSLFFIIRRKKILNIGFLLSDIVLLAMTWSHLYAYSLFIAFYRIMSKHVLRGNLPKMIRISYGIHRIKAKLEVMFSPFLIFTFCGICTDVHNLFAFLREQFFVRYAKTTKDVPFTKRLFLVVMTLPDAIGTSFEIYSIGCLCDTLVHVERIFQEKARVFAWKKYTKKRKPMQMDIDVLLLHDKIHDLSVWAYRLIRVDRVFAFEFFLGIVVMFVIAYLQYIATEALSSHSKI